MQLGKFLIHFSHVYIKKIMVNLTVIAITYLNIFNIIKRGITNRAHICKGGNRYFEK